MTGVIAYLGIFHLEASWIIIITDTNIRIGGIN